MIAKTSAAFPIGCGRGFLIMSECRKTWPVGHDPAEEAQLVLLSLFDVDPNANIPHLGVWNGFIESLRFFIAGGQGNQGVYILLF